MQINDTVLWKETKLIEELETYCCEYKSKTMFKVIMIKIGSKLTLGLLHL